MNSLPIVVVGFLLGMLHATDADHVIAVSTIVSRQRNLESAASIGVLWGVGHTLTVFLVGGAIILFSLVIPPRLGLVMEFCVALMLILLGVLTLRGVSRWVRENMFPAPDGSFSRALPRCVVPRARICTRMCTATTCTVTCTDTVPKTTGIGRCHAAGLARSPPRRAAGLSGFAPARHRRRARHGRLGRRRAADSGADPRPALGPCCICCCSAWAPSAGMMLITSVDRAAVRVQPAAVAASERLDAPRRGHPQPGVRPLPGLSDRLCGWVVRWQPELVSELAAFASDRTR